VPEDASLGTQSIDTAQKRPLSEAPSLRHIFNLGLPHNQILCKLKKYCDPKLQCMRIKVLWPFYAVSWKLNTENRTM
jgi:hypothetical protein